MNKFIEELEGLINKYSLENDSNTPDFILAQYLNGCLKIFNETVNNREKWYCRLDEPKSINILDDNTGNPPFKDPTIISKH